MDSGPSTKQVFAEFATTIIWPALVLMMLSSEERLGPMYGLVVALAGPLVWGVASMLLDGKVSALAALSFVSTLLTGGVGLFELDAQWLAIKEAMIPLGLGIATFSTAHTRYSAVLTLLDRLLDPDKLADAIGDDSSGYHTLTTSGSRKLGVLFFFSAFANYFLCAYLVTSPSGTEAFNEELGRLTLYSWPAIALPSMVAMVYILNTTLNGLDKLTGCELDDLLRPAFAPKQEG